MDRRGRRLRFTAVAALVVLALTGFSTSRGHGHGHSSGHGSGGGCSSSSQDHDSSSSSSGGTSGSRYRDYDDDDDYTGGTSGGSGSSTPSVTLRDATVKLIDCATPSRPYATVELTNPNATGGYFTVTVDFLDAGSGRVQQRNEDAYAAGNATATVRVDLSTPSVAARIDHCEAQPAAPAR
ncbi:hypothetical protein PYK79_16495 [Streptomyces sp. ID05-04B]|uniref:hypothetical protein n=1 Tax=Streptomyces sp. ID05-04B TaxID=3028661 RepID=UPI0029C1D524|nr:hypothetical protein [Streptomyces sp. ID05-04B]MDX5564608.1 hypothetical protein [Streptomyces sp. ID05-04B]